jgi:hypothetical protein
MKIISFFAALFILFFQTGCKQSTEPTGPDMYVSFELENSFQNDSVRVVVDNTILDDRRITTNAVLSLAWSSGLQRLSRNNHVVRLSVPEYGVQKEYSVGTTNDTSTVLIGFSKETKVIEIRQMKGRIFRD